ncbi:unnamed protein product [Clavelina lepadiformis]|uniref:Uncharacterized protein n=1 Tax=Clavelina lepadiformis TaxID=159417 RepID=A0ABP0FY41_CLALP
MAVDALFVNVKTFDRENLSSRKIASCRRAAAYPAPTTEHMPTAPGPSATRKVSARTAVALNLAKPTIAFADVVRAGNLTMTRAKYLS